jgi:hypothetical protein
MEKEAPGVSGSILEGLDEMLTVNRLRLPPELRRSLACTNAIENMQGTIRRVARNARRRMPHDISLIATITMGLVLAYFGGLVAHRLRLPPLVGYLLAGVALGPFTPGFVGDANLASQLAEIGVILLMFGVGLHFSIKDLLAVRAIALPGAIVQIAVATGSGVALALLWGWGLGAGLVLGLALSVASTVVLLRALEQRTGWIRSMAASRSDG